jgi:hypothetical protein
VTVAFYAVCLLLIAAGPGSSLLGAMGFIGWVVAMVLASANVLLGGLALAWDGRKAGGTAALALGLFAAGVVVSALLLSALPSQN